MLQSHANQLRTKYMTILRRETDLRPEDIGAVRLAIGMALSELQDEHRQQLNELDDITGDVIEERDQLKVLVASNESEILRLQTMEDRLVAWVQAHEPVTDNDDVAAIVIDILTKYRTNGATLVPAAPVAVNANGSGNGHVQITDLGTRYTGRRLNVDDTQLRQLAIDKIQLLAHRLGHTPAQSDWNRNLGPDEPSLTSVKARLHMNWNDMVAAAGLTPNLNSHQKAAKKEAKAENAEAPFRGN